MNKTSLTGTWTGVAKQTIWHQGEDDPRGRVKVGLNMDLGHTGNHVAGSSILDGKFISMDNQLLFSTVEQQAVEGNVQSSHVLIQTYTLDFNDRAAGKKVIDMRLEGTLSQDGEMIHGSWSFPDMRKDFPQGQTTENVFILTRSRGKGPDGESVDAAAEKPLSTPVTVPAIVG